MENVKETAFKELMIDEELKNLLPPLNSEEYNLLEENIINNGCLNPILIWNNYIVDGHNRYNICNLHNISFEVKIVEFEDKSEVIRWMIDNQMGRRNLNVFQRILIAEKYREYFEKIIRENKGNNKRTRVELAKIAQTSETNYARAMVILKSKNKDIINNIIIGNISFHEAYEKVKSKDKENIIQRKPISSLTLKHLISRSNSHCEICDWGGLGLEGVLIPHHIHKYSDTQDNSLENLIMICP